MKKIYVNPTAEVVEMEVLQPLMTTSVPLSDTEITGSGEILAPDLGDEILIDLE